MDLFLTLEEKEFFDASMEVAKEEDLEREQCKLELGLLQQQLAAESARAERTKQDCDAMKKQLQAAQAAGYIPIEDPELSELVSSLGTLHIWIFLPDQFRDFLKAMLGAFELSDIRMLIRTRLGVDNPEALLRPTADLQDNMYALLRWAEMNGKVEGLLVASLLEKPYNHPLRMCIKKIMIAAQQPP